MTYKMTKIEIGGGIIEFPKLRHKKIKKDAYYVGKNDQGNNIFYCDKGYCFAEDLEIIPQWFPEQGERVLIDVDEEVYIAKYIKSATSCFHCSIVGFIFHPFEIAKYDPSKTVPETWAEVEKSGEVLRV